MSFAKKWALLLEIMIVPIIPLLYLYNQNVKFLDLSQVLITALAFSVITVALFLLFRAIFRSGSAAFFACVSFVVSLFVFSSIYNRLNPEHARVIFLYSFPIAYLIGFIFVKIFKTKEWDRLPILAGVILVVLLLFNTFPLVFHSTQNEPDREIKYKTDYVVDNSTPSPNVYWFLCDGMLGFDAMEQYFGDRQEKLTEDLTQRGFEINRSASFESGHWTRIAVPALMCPDYYDTYLKPLLTSNEAAVALRERTGTGMDQARKYNETIQAFHAKGYTTAVISLDAPYFYPTTDYFYYIQARFLSPKDYVTVPKLVANIQDGEETNIDARFYAYQLGELFLGGIPGSVYDALFPDSDLIEQNLETDFTGVSDVLFGSYGKINTALVTSLYDTLHSPAFAAPKFVIVHDFLAHMPFDMDENGDELKVSASIQSYPAQHTYAARVLVNLVGMILAVDSDAVIVLQADHGLHTMTPEQITNAFGAKAVVDIWNDVFSAVRIPKKYQGADEQAILSTPLNISRYLVNHFVGENYTYLTNP